MSWNRRLQVILFTLDLKLVLRLLSYVLPLVGALIERRKASKYANVIYEIDALLEGYYDMMEDGTITQEETEKLIDLLNDVVMAWRDAREV